MTIKHLVISGGGPSFFQTLGAAEYLHQQKYYDIQEIETIYGTSAGTLVGTLLCLKYDDYNMINDYVIKRPWKDVYQIKIQNILDAYSRKGLFDYGHIEKTFKPLLEAKELSLNITLNEFYEYSNIELHFMTFEVNQFELTDISYKTHPDLSLLKAIQMSCAIPVIISPVIMEDKCYIDGGVSCNYPLLPCLEEIKKRQQRESDPAGIEKGVSLEDTVLGFQNIFDKSYEVSKITVESTLLEYVLSFLFKLIYSLSKNFLPQPKIKNELNFYTEPMNLATMKKAIYLDEERKKLMEKGVERAKEFLASVAQETIGVDLEPELEKFQELQELPEEKEEAGI